MNKVSIVLLTMTISLFAEQCGRVSDLLNDSWYGEDQIQKNLAWAECAMRNGNVEAAMSAYERVIMADSMNADAALALTRIYIDFGMDREVQMMLRSLENIRLDPRQRRVVAELMSDHASLISARAKLLLSVGYDTNVNYSIVEDNFAGSVRGPREESFYHLLMGKANLKHDISEQGGAAIEGNVNVDWKDNYQGFYYDMFSGTVDAGVSYDGTWFLLYVPLMYNRTHYLGHDLFSRYGIAPSLTLQFGNDILLNLGAKLLQREYALSRDTGRNDILTAADVGLYWFFDEDFIYAQADFDQYYAQKSTPVRFTDRRLVRLFGGFSYGIGDVLALSSDYQYAYVDFDDTAAVNSTSRRNDRFHQLKASVARSLDEHWRAIVDYTYADNRSNFETAEYYKQMISLGIEYNY